MPQHNENESAEETTQMCLKLFAALGADVSIQDIDISHRNLQELLFEANKYKRANNFKFCWTRNKTICLRKSENDNM